MEKLAKLPKGQNIDRIVEKIVVEERERNDEVPLVPIKGSDRTMEVPSGRYV